MSSTVARIAVHPARAENPFVGAFTHALGETGSRVEQYSPSIASLRGTDIAILHWPNEFFSRTGRKKSYGHLARILIARARGTRFIWVAHNLRPHERFEATPVLTGAFLRALDGIIYLSAASRDLVHQTYPAARGARELVTVHGRYPDVTPSQPFAPPPADAPVRLSAFGIVRPYKNWDVLVAAAARATKNSLTLTLTGRRGDDARYCSDLETAAGAAGNIDIALSDDFLPIEDIERVVDEAHGVVLPYRDILNSGSALQALSRNRPVLVPAIGSMPELQAQVGGEWVYLYEGELDAAVLERFAAAVRDDPRGARPDLSLFEWDRIGRQLRNFVARVARRRD